MDLVLLSRLQFALTACYHWLFVPLTLGLGVVMSVMETMYVVKKDDFWRSAARFWQKLFGINFAIGVATGIILEFEFGTNFSNYSWFVGDIFGAPLAIEGILAFFMEATFIAIMFFGWDKVGKKTHLMATWLTSIGTMISAWWILVANSWMQHPVGMNFNPDTVRNEMMDFFTVAFQPTAVIKFTHAVSSGWMTGAMFVIAVAAWFLMKKKNVELAKRSILVAAIVGLVGAGLCFMAGDKHGVEIAKTQPMKLAAAEGLMDGSNEAPFSFVPGIEVPHMLSILATHDFNGYVWGVNDLKVEGEKQIARGKMALEAFRIYRENRETNDSIAQEALVVFNEHKQYFGYGYLDSADELVPNVTICYWCFRGMIACGSLVALIFVLSLFFSWKGWLERYPWFMWLCLLGLPCVYIAGQCGWIFTEVGRQPWAIQGLLPVKAAVSSVSASSVLTTVIIFATLFTSLLVAEVRIMLRAIKNHKED